MPSEIQLGGQPHMQSAVVPAQSVPSKPHAALLHEESHTPSEIQLGGQPDAQSGVEWPLRQEVTESHTVVRAVLTSAQVLKVPSSAEVSIVHVRP